MAFRAVLFDLGQTLLEYPGNTHEFWRGFAERRLVEMHPLFRDVCEGIDGDSASFAARAMHAMWPERKINMSGKSWHFAERLRAVLAAYGREECTDGECDRLTEAFYEPIGPATKRYPETLAVLEALREGGTRMAIISNAPWDVPGRLLRADMRRWEIEEFFDVFVTSGESPWRKPNPEFMWAAARELDVKPEACLVVGDSLKADIAGARAAGMKSVWVNREGLDGGDEADWVVGDLEGIPEITSENG
jgi:putative hydrolase of the HAD superfamily